MIDIAREHRVRICSSGYAARFGNLLLPSASPCWRQGAKMLGLAVTALVISLVAGALGFTGVAAGAASIAKIIFGIFLVIAVIFFIMIATGISIMT